MYYVTVGNKLMYCVPILGFNAPLSGAIVNRNCQFAPVTEQNYMVLYPSGY